MEPNFQTSFIPKKPMVEERVSTSRPIGLLMTAALFLLFAVLIGSGGLYFYKGTLEKTIEQNKKDLSLAQNRFEPAKIAQMQLVDKRLQAASEVLSKHIAISPIFQALEEITLKTVRYTKFSYNLNNTGSPKVKVRMNGVAVGYRSVALQSDLFPKNRNIIDPVFSNLVLDERGNVTFDLDFSVDPTFVDYKEMLKRASSTTP
ncbi:hypothetical protein A3I95_03435 [Candidatus Nomurabacteria bacterium RIFCSPLOWO2_02_FULL_44_12]|uniref:Uncharacterized protein n=1 Tax=Candidatus Nomurabacteria bacterium RIFCSPLOWO2_12_FULL_44_11 TaxID=1801796 RepID=A0A1F6Y762_9BACT|nr:MAG: hypothetical protein A3E95_00925 [Candidatus Nomurabacteria bacterium RIFCSPHIGHO2_12_FULL_44_22b]OGJ02176.1 MAG: hypothetical protein A3G53_02175 [Candidatus Nomurabacteria bacterium RIFCSPLOWO2_12_FULL_44_11]OGJ07649.1 MAG: hypothetical protein A3I95_03435 [Candidatus Nomurabacteria bacterium RIFCSPLOWO2_02_FULL_44_12]